jgi:hypothetical protein
LDVTHFALVQTLQRMDCGSACASAQCGHVPLENHKQRAGANAQTAELPKESIDSRAAASMLRLLKVLGLYSHHAMHARAAATLST